MSEEVEKKTFIERVFDTLFSAQSKDTKGFLLVLSILGNVYLINLNLKQNTELNGKIVEEVRRQVTPAVTKEVEPLKNRVDTTAQVVKDVSTNIDQFIKKHK